MSNIKNNGKSLFSLQGKTIMVCGGCGLIGKAICEALSKCQVNLIIADIQFDKAKQFSEELHETGNSRVTPALMDITSEKSVVSGLDEAIEQYNEINGFVNVSYPRNKSYGLPFFEVPFQSWRENIDLHLNGYFLSAQKVAHYLKEHGGSMVLFGSIYGFLGPDFGLYEGTKMTNPPEYAAIKGGIINLTRYLATCLAQHHIRVNCVSPGGIYDHQPPAFVERYCKKTPLGRMGAPEDLAGIVLFLLSDASSYITGQNFIVDGGWSAW